MINNILSQSPIENILSRLNNVKRAGNEYLALCPCHDDKKQSLSIKEGTDGRVLIHCHANCEAKDIVLSLGLEMKDLFPVENKQPVMRKGRGRIVATYDYRGSEGELIYQAVRLEPKDFRLRRPDGNDGWIWNGKGITPIPYRLPEVLEAIKSGQTIFITEGEKDVNNLFKIGVVATCNHGGAGKWRESHAKYFPNETKVVVLTDNDDPGRQHGVIVARMLIAQGCKVKVVELPGLPSKGDVSDWIAIRHVTDAKDELFKIVEAVPEWTDPAPQETLTGDSPKDKTKLPLVYNDWLKILNQTGRYTAISPGYLCYTKKHETQMGIYIEEIPIANFIPKPISEITRDDGREQIKTFTIEGLMAPGVPLPPVNVPAKDFTGMSWVASAWGLGAAIEPGRGSADRVRHAIQSLANDLPRQTIYTHLGWRRISDKWVYLHSTGAIGDDDITVEPGEGLRRYTLPAKSEPGAMKESLRSLQAAPLEVTLPLWATVFLSPLCEPLRQAGIEPAFVIWLLGQTGALKSTLAALFLSHFGEFSNKNLPASFKDTENALERRAFLGKDTLLVVDDYHPVSNAQDAKVMKKLAQSILRGYGDRVGRTRMRADTTVREGFPPRGMCIVTGEDVPDAGQSTTARFMAVEVPKGAVNMEILSACQAEAEKLPGAMRGYLEWVAPRLDSLVKSLKHEFIELRKQTTANSRHGRLAEAVAWLYIGLFAGLTYATTTGAISTNEMGTMLKNGLDVFLKLAETQGQRIIDERPSEKFCTILRESITSGAAFLMDIRSSVFDANPLPGQGFLGWKDNDYAYLLPEMTYKLVSQFAQQQGGHFPVTARMLWKHLDVDGFIEAEETGNTKRFARQKKIGGRNMRVLWLKLSVIQPDDDINDEKPF